MRPDFGIIQEREGRRHCVVVDTQQAKYQGIPWLQLGNFGKRKFENLLYLMKPTKNTKILYV